jgi:hypothetical protein
LGSCPARQHAMQRRQQQRRRPRVLVGSSTQRSARVTPRVSPGASRAAPAARLAPHTSPAGSAAGLCHTHPHLVCGVPQRSRLRCWCQRSISHWRLAWRQRRQAAGAPAWWAAYASWLVLDATMGPLAPACGAALPNAHAAHAPRSDLLLVNNNSTKTHCGDSHA